MGQAIAAMGLEFKQLGARVRSAHCFRVSPDPGESWRTAMESRRRHRQVQRRVVQGEIGSCFNADALRCDCDALEGGFSRRFSPSRGGLHSFASPYNHKTNRRWAASAAAARPWFARPRQQGRHPHKILKVLTEAAENQARAPAMGMRRADPRISDA